MGCRGAIGCHECESSRQPNNDGLTLTVFHKKAACTPMTDADLQHLAGLTPAQGDAWQRDGFLVLPGFKSAADVAAVCARARVLVDAFEPTTDSGVFSTRDRSNQCTRIRDAALLASAEQVHCFFEEEAFDAQGRLCVPKAQAINKIGHALHDRDPVFDRFSHGPALHSLATALGLAQPQVWQSQVIFKQPHIGGEVGWHQDASFFKTEPHTVTTFWFALEDATLDNGCLWVQAGGHRGPLREQYLCEGEGVGDGVCESGHPDRHLRMQALDATPWPDTRTAQALPVAAGTLVVFHGLLPHCSAANRSPQSRLAYTLHVTDASASYSPLNWLQRSAGLPVRGLA